MLHWERRGKWVSCIFVKMRGELGKKIKDKCLDMNLVLDLDKS